MDRIDMVVAVSRVPQKELLADSGSEKTEEDKIRQQIQSARDIQNNRNRGKTNSALNNRSINTTARLTPAAKTLLSTATDRLNLSARSYFKIARVARTIADLNGSEEVTEKEDSEALQYRPSED